MNRVFGRVVLSALALAGIGHFAFAATSNGCVTCIDPGKVRLGDSGGPCYGLADLGEGEGTIYVDVADDLCLRTTPGQSVPCRGTACCPPSGLEEVVIKGYFGCSSSVSPPSCELETKCGSFCCWKKPMVNPEISTACLGARYYVIYCPPTQIE